MNAGEHKHKQYPPSPGTKIRAAISGCVPAQRIVVAGLATLVSEKVSPGATTTIMRRRWKVTRGEIESIVELYRLY